MMAEDEKSREHFSTGHRSFLRQAVYSLYVANRVSEAAKWFKYLGEKYPDKPVIDNDPNSFPRTLTLEEYAVSNLQIDINETSRDRVKAAIEGFLVQSYTSLILGDDNRAAGFRLLANKVWTSYRGKIPNDRWAAIGLPPVAETSRVIRDNLLSPEGGLAPEERAILRSALGIFGEPTPAPTNSANPALPNP
jgi:hypothetical protein